MNLPPLRRLSPSPVLLALLAASQGTAFAAQEGQAERLVVTGSHIKRIDHETASPVLVIDRASIDSSGSVTLSELLQQSVYNSAGSFNEALTTGFTPGAAAFDLRSFGPERTLVLVDGRRHAIYPFGAGGSNAFVDLNSIPLASVQRIEILKDGASALYGSDAVSGVVNIITYQRFDGVEARARYKAPTEGGAETRSMALMAGGEAGAWNWLAGFDASRANALEGKDRSYARSLRRDLGGEIGVVDARSLNSGEGWQFNTRTREFAPLGECPAYQLSPANEWFTGDPAGTVCVYDYARQSQLLPEVERFSVDGRLGYALDEVDLSLRYGIVGVDTLSTGFQTSTPVGQQAQTIDGDRVIIRRRLTELGTPSVDTDSRTDNLALAAEWQWAGFDWEATAYYNRSDIDETLNHGWLLDSDAERLDEQVISGEIDLRQRLSAAEVDGFTSHFEHRGESEVKAQDLRFSGPLFDTSLGPVLIAAGLEHRREDFYDRSDEAILGGHVVGYGTSGAEGGRELGAAYVESAIPLADSLEASASLRHDRYNDFGSTANPKLGLRWNPTEDLLVRASWGTGFRAPGLHQLHTNLNLGSVGDTSFVQSGNRDLEAEESESTVVGLLYEPKAGMEFSLEHWRIDVDNVITNLGAGTILNLCQDAGAPSFCAGRLLQPGTTYVAPNGQVLPITSLTVNDSFLNLAGRNARGYDLGLRLRFDEVLGGTLKWDTELSYLASLEETPYPGGADADLDGNNRNPHWRAKTGLRWQGSEWSHFMGLSHVGGSHIVDVEGANWKNVQSYTQLDYQLGYEYASGQKLVLGVQNIGNEKPPVSSTSWPYFAQDQYSPLGRTVSLEWQGRF
ncbi:MAG: TonB-dependent receptor [Gammaproteobacteria bacterium]|nr:TonB-dependent receptor [Gammaproteobacteria bacterium]